MKTRISEPTVPHLSVTGLFEKSELRLLYKTRLGDHRLLTKPMPQMYRELIPQVSATREISPIGRNWDAKRSHAKYHYG